jgi:hypothetical protein
MDHHDIVVFLGPSLPVDEARRIVPARYLGPAQCGDVLRARRLSPKVIAIVDGVFATAPSIWHKEILLAIDDGITVVGASSMGALRAAELAPFGMIGIGRIFDAYRDGVYTDDDEVALLHGPAESGYREMSEAMVNIRATVAHAVSAGVIGQASAGRVIRCAKDSFYQERSMVAAAAAAWAGDSQAEERREFLRFIANGGYVNQKRLDALELLKHLAERGTAREVPTSTVHRTSFIRKLHFDTTCRPFEADDVELPIDERVALEARGLGLLYPLVCRLARLMAVVHALGGDLLETEADTRFRNRLVRLRAVVDRNEQRHGQRAVARVRQRHMLDMMRLDGAYRRFRDAPRAAGAEVHLYRRCARLWAIVDDHLERTHVELPQTLQTLSDEFRRKRGLERRDATLAWRRSNDLDWRGYERMLALEARLAFVTAGVQAHAVGLLPATDPACWLIDAIRLAGLYARLEKRVARAGPLRRGAHAGRRGVPE